MENYQLNAALASSCSSQGYTPIRQYESNCSYDHGQFYNFFNCQVDLTSDANDGNDAICYHGPVATNGMIFTWS